MKENFVMVNLLMNFLKFFEKFLSLTFDVSFILELDAIMTRGDKELKKQLLILFLCIAVAVSAVGWSYAYMTAKAEQNTRIEIGDIKRCTQTVYIEGFCPVSDIPDELGAPGGYDSNTYMYYEDLNGRLVASGYYYEELADFYAEIRNNDNLAYLIDINNNIKTDKIYGNFLLGITDINLGTEMDYLIDETKFAIQSYIYDYSGTEAWSLLNYQYNHPEMDVEREYWYGNYYLALNPTYYEAEENTPGRLALEELISSGEICCEPETREIVRDEEYQVYCDWNENSNGACNNWYNEMPNLREVTVPMLFEFR